MSNPTANSSKSYVLVSNLDPALTKAVEEELSVRPMQFEVQRYV